MPHTRLGHLQPSQKNKLSEIMRVVNQSGTIISRSDVDSLSSTSVSAYGICLDPAPEGLPYLAFVGAHGKTQYIPINFEGDVWVLGGDKPFTMSGTNLDEMVQQSVTVLAKTGKVSPLPLGVAFDAAKVNIAVGFDRQSAQTALRSTRDKAYCITPGSELGSLVIRTQDKNVKIARSFGEEHRQWTYCAAGVGSSYKTLQDVIKAMSQIGFEYCDRAAMDAHAHAHAHAQIADPLLQSRMSSSETLFAALENQIKVQPVITSKPGVEDVLKAMHDLTATIKKADFSSDTGQVQMQAHYEALLGLHQQVASSVVGSAFQPTLIQVVDGMAQAFAEHCKTEYNFSPADSPSLGI